MESKNDRRQHNLYRKSKSESVNKKTSVIVIKKIRTICIQESVNKKTSAIVIKKASDIKNVNKKLRTRCIQEEAQSICD